MNFTSPQLSSSTSSLTQTAVFLFFAAFLLIGALLFKDYGMYWDDVPIRDYGVLAYDYVFKGDHALYDRGGRYHGTAFELPLVILEEVFRVRDPRNIYLMRHGAVFLTFFAGVCFFYRLLFYRFRNAGLGLLGCLFLILSPRIFADAFYNTKDIPCLSFFIISMYALIRFLDEKTIPRAIYLALASAFLIDIRILGVIVPVFAVIFSISDWLLARREGANILKELMVLILYGVLTAALTVLFWPVLWEDPTGQFIRAFRQMMHYSWYNDVLYLGTYMKATQIPWHYLLVWIPVTTPLFYTAAFLAGIFIAGASLLRDPIKFYRERRSDLVILTWFFLPLGAVIFFQSVLYDGWRQMFYIYPAFVALAVLGLTGLFGMLARGFPHLPRRVLLGCFTLAVLLGLWRPVAFMVRYHPYQNVYFNELVGGMDRAKQNFDMDFWALTYKEGLEEILDRDSSSEIKVAFHRKGGARSFNLIPASGRERLKLVETPEEADYFLSNYRWHREEYPYPNEFYSVKIGGAKIMTVFKLRGELPK